MKVSLVIREGAGNERRYLKLNKKRIYPEGTVFCLRYQRKYETLIGVTNQTAALAARAGKEAALLTDQPSCATAPAKRVAINDAISFYLSNIAATKSTRPCWRTPVPSPRSARVAPSNFWALCLDPGDPETEFQLPVWQPSWSDSVLPQIAMPGPHMRIPSCKGKCSEFDTTVSAPVRVAIRS